MATAVSSEPAEIVRPSANFQPSLWGNLFADVSLDNQARDKYGKEHEILKEEVRMMLLDHATNHNISKKISFINVLERLGVSYQFEKEIDELLRQMFDAHSQFQDDIQQLDFFTLGIYFRILRQHGYRISCDVFKKLKDKDGEFKDELKDDAIGMLSLYEATHVRAHGEDILEEALVFAKARLESMAATISLCPFLANQIKRALVQALHRGIPRVEARNFISIYEQDPNKIDLLLRFSKIDFNLLQMLHNQELSHVSRWWKDSELEPKLTYARNRVAECFLWAVCLFFEPKYSSGRILFGKLINIVSVMDDTYDAYGTLDELRLFTNAVQRFDRSSMNQLPDYMKIIYKAILDLFDEVEDELSKHETDDSYRVAYAKREIKELVMRYETEQEWFHERYVPAFGEYIENSIVTAGNQLAVPFSYLGMDQVATVQAYEWAKSKPKMITACGAVLRLADDIMSRKEEDERGHVATGIECYVKEHRVSEEEAVVEFYKMIENAWKDINKEFIAPNRLHVDLLTRVLNLSRIVDVVYKHEDGYTHPERTLKHHIIDLFIHPITI